MSIAKTSGDRWLVVQLSMDGNTRTCCAGRWLGEPSKSSCTGCCNDFFNINQNVQKARYACDCLKLVLKIDKFLHHTQIVVIQLFTFCNQIEHQSCTCHSWVNNCQNIVTASYKDVRMDRVLDKYKH